jgi:hypothetical protein
LYSCGRCCVVEAVHLLEAVYIHMRFITENFINVFES